MPVLEMKIKISASTIKPQRIEQKAGEKSVWDYSRSPRLEKDADQRCVNDQKIADAFS
jgi:hypothetical protein